MKSKLLLTVAFLSIVLTSCTAKAPVPSSASDPEETAVPTTEHPIPWLDRTLEYLPEVLPEQYREVLSPWDPYTRALLTDGVVIVAPDMKFSSLPQNFRDTLKCIDSDLPYGQYLDADVQEFQDVLCSVYENDDLQIITAYFDPLKEDLYSDAGIEYIRVVHARSDHFCTYQGVRLGDSAETYTSQDAGTSISTGTPYMTYVTDNGKLADLFSSSFAEISSLKDRVADISFVKD